VDDDTSSQTRPATNEYSGGYKVKPAVKEQSDDASESKKPPKEKKAKHHKDSDESAPVYTPPAADTNTAPAKSKASEGY
jgi:hypothetical protein